MFNITVGERTSLSSLLELIRDTLALHHVRYDRKPYFGDFSPGDVRHSEADISKAKPPNRVAPTHDVGEGLAAAVPWCLVRFRKVAV